MPAPWVHEWPPDARAEYKNTKMMMSMPMAWPNLMQPSFASRRKMPMPPFRDWYGLPRRPQARKGAPMPIPLALASHISPAFRAPPFRASAESHARRRHKRRALSTRDSIIYFKREDFLFDTSAIRRSRDDAITKHFGHTEASKAPSGCTIDIRALTYIDTFSSTGQNYHIIAIIYFKRFHRQGRYARLDRESRGLEALAAHSATCIFSIFIFSAMNINFRRKGMLARPYRR